MSNKPSKKILIFGSGFISRFIALEALSQGIEPIVLFNNHPLEDANDVEQLCISSCDIDSLLIKTQPSYIVCLQGSSFVPDNKNLMESLNSNLITILSFMERVMVLVKDGLYVPEKIVLVGSAAEYGKSFLEPIDESFPLRPVSIYGLTKIYLYNTAMYYYEKGLPVIYTRQFNCTGPYQRQNFVIPSVCRQIAMIEKGEKCSLEIGDTYQERDFIDVRDAARAYLAILDRGVTGEIYNIGTGHTHSIAEVLELAITKAKHKHAIHIETNRDLFFDKGAISNRICSNITKLRSLGFAPQTSLKQTIADTLDFWRERA